MDGHLITVEIGIVSRADQGMNANGFAFNKLRFKSLDREPVQCGSAIQQDWMAARNFFKDVPDLGGLSLDHFLRRANGVHIAQLFEAADDKWLEQHEGHFLGQAALMQFKFRSDNNDRAAGVIDTFAEKVLAKAPALALEHVAEGLQRTIAGAGDGATMAAIIEE